MPISNGTWLGLGLDLLYILGAIQYFPDLSTAICISQWINRSFFNVLECLLYHLAILVCVTPLPVGYRVSLTYMYQYLKVQVQSGFSVNSFAKETTSVPSLCIILSRYSGEKNYTGGKNTDFRTPAPAARLLTPFDQVVQALARFLLVGSSQLNWCPRKLRVSKSRIPIYWNSLYRSFEAMRMSDTEHLIGCVFRFGCLFTLAADLLAVRAA